MILVYSLLSSSRSRLCPGQLQMTRRSIDTQSHSQVSGLDLEIDSIIGRSHHHHPPTQETFWREITLIYLGPTSSVAEWIRIRTTKKKGENDPNICRPPPPVVKFNPFFPLRRSISFFFYHHRPILYWQYLYLKELYISKNSHWHWYFIVAIITDQCYIADIFIWTSFIFFL